MLKLENPQYLCHLLDPGNDLGPVSLEMQHVAFPIFRVSRPCLQRKQEDIRLHTCIAGTVGGEMPIYVITWD